MHQSRQTCLFRAADAAGFATVWHSDESEIRRGGFARLFSRLASLFG